MLKKQIFINPPVRQNTGSMTFLSILKLFTNMILLVSQSIFSDHRSKVVVGDWPFKYLYSLKKVNKKLWLLLWPSPD